MTPATSSPEVTVVVPTTGRPALARLLTSLAQQDGGAPGPVLVVDDRPPGMVPLRLPAVPEPTVLRSGGRGPAAARNAGWRAARTPWVAFLDDDVVCPPGWAATLRRDLRDDLGGSQGGIRVPRVAGRRPTDWERQVQGLERARWATADMAYRRCALEHVGGFDERFTAAYREDADLAVRVRESGYRLDRGERWVEHAVPRADPWTSVRRQRGNADDALLLAKYGLRWRRRTGAPPGRRLLHLAGTACAAVALGAVLRRRPAAAAAAATGWAVATGGFALERILPGPRTRTEMSVMASTSVVIPPLATFHWLRGLAGSFAGGRPLAVLFDRDGTLIDDVPYNGDPDRVRLRAGAAEVCARLREMRVPIGVVSNQSGIGRGLVTADAVGRVNARLEDLLGPIQVWAICPHAPEAGCDCRKPAPGLIRGAARRLGVPPHRVGMVGDIGSDLEAAASAGARGVLVPTVKTRREEVAAARVVADDLPAAMKSLFGGAW